MVAAASAAAAVAAAAGSAAAAAAAASLEAAASAAAAAAAAAAVSAASAAAVAAAAAGSAAAAAAAASAAAAAAAAAAAFAAVAAVAAADNSTVAASIIGVAASPSPLAPRMYAGADWSGLPPEILHLISLFLTNIWDYLRFRAVCSSWRSSCTARPPQIPSLLLPYDTDTTARSFLDPSDFRVHTIDIPEARGKWIYGTPHGWLVMLMENNGQNNGHFDPCAYTLDVSLLNPITRDHISLPPLPGYAVNMVETEPMLRNSVLRDSTNHTKPFLTANPNSSTHTDFLALLVDCTLVFCRLGGDVWTVVDVHVDKGIAVVDFTYLNGAFYVVNATSGITVVDATTLKKTYTGPPTRRRRNAGDDFYLVESSGDLLLLEITSRGSGPVTVVFKLVNTGRKLKWARIEESIGDRALFVSCNRSAISLSSGDYIRNRGDLICFAGHHSCNKDYADMVANIHISDIVAGSSTGKQRYWKGSEGARRVSNSLLGLTWIIPSLH